MTELNRKNEPYIPMPLILCVCPLNYNPCENLDRFIFMAQTAAEMIHIHSSQFLGFFS